MHLDVQLFMWQFLEKFKYTINCETELILTWSNNCVLADMTVANNPPTGLELQITETKLFVPVVTLSKENDTKLFKQIKSGFKRTVKWNKYR